MKKQLLGALAAGALIATVIGCSSSDPNTLFGRSGSPADTAAVPAGAATVSVAQGSLGSYLVDGSGKSLYAFDLDTAGQSKCSDQCAQAWPPFVIANGQSVVANGNAQGSSLNGIGRSDGSAQVTYNGLPLYYFSGDQVAGDTKGQGLDSFGASWWLVKPDGTKLTTTTASAGTGS